jgi:hypothetical protein
LNLLVIIVIIVLVFVGLDIVEFILIMQVMLRLDDVAAAEIIALPSIQVKEYAQSAVAVNDHF